MSLHVKGAMDRRSFIAAAAVGALGIVGTGALGGCSSSSAQESGSSKQTYNITDTRDVDVVVVGSGGTGCSAAFRAAELGLNVVLVEKQASTGGTSRCSEGLFAIGSSIQKALGVEISEQHIISEAMDYHHWIPDTDLYQTYFSASAANVEWMIGNGIEFETVTSLGTSAQTWHVYKTDASGLPGNLYMQTWAKIVADKGVEIVTNTTGSEIEMDNGKVAGLICDSGDGTYLEVKAKAIILGTGGYSDDADMVVALSGYDRNRFSPSGMGGRTGDGITMAQSVGAALAPFPGTVMFYGGKLPGTTFGQDIFAATSFEPLLWVNQDAKRFCNEMVSENNFSYSGNSQIKQKRVVSILTKAQMDQFVNEGSIFGCAQYIARGQKLTKLWDQYNALVSGGSTDVYQADSIAGLAEQAGLDADALQTTVDEYNDYCDTGVDLEFEKDSQYLLPVEEGPFYGFNLEVGYFTTVGGLKVDTKAEVLDSAGDPIPGLYAGGCDAGGLYGDSYDVTICAGSQQGWAVHTGKTAAESAAAYLG